MPKLSLTKPQRDVLTRLLTATVDAVNAYDQHKNDGPYQGYAAAGKVIMSTFQRINVGVTALVRLGLIVDGSVNPDEEPSGDYAEIDPSRWTLAEIVQALLAIDVDFRGQHGREPTTDEITKLLGIAPEQVRAALEHIEKATAAYDYIDEHGEPMPEEASGPIETPAEAKAHAEKVVHRVTRRLKGKDKS